MIRDRSDETLYEAYLNSGDSEALKALLLRHREELTFFIYGIVGNYEDAEEIMLDAYAVAASGTTRFQGKSSFKTWLFGIGRNLALKRVRKKRFLFVPINDEITKSVKSAEAPENEVLTSERDRLLYEALEKLPPDYKEALHLAFFENMSNDEVAVIMKKTKKQVYNLIERGKKELKKKLSDYDYEFF